MHFPEEQAVSGSTSIAGFSTLETANQVRVENYAANLQQGLNLNSSATEGFSAMVDRLSLFLNKAEDIGVNAGDGMTGDEYLLVSNAVNADSGLKQQLQDLHQIYTDDFQNDIPKEMLVNGQDLFANVADLHGEYGIEGRNTLNEDGNVNDTVDQAAADFNTLTDGVVNGTLTDKAQEAEAAGGAAGAEAGGGEETSAAGEETDGAGETGASETSDTAGGGGDEGGGLSSLWAALLGLFDKDGDGKISPEEFREGMAKLDTNGDGKLSKEELVAGGMSEEQASEMMTAMDGDGDGAISMEGADSELDTFMTELNADGDSEITQAELGELITPATGTSDVNAELEMA
jgi:hypothetical protein